MYKHSQALLLGIFFLFFLQLLSDFIESIYAFGLVMTQFTIEVISILLIFAPAALLFFRGGLKRPALLALAGAGLACRFAGPLLPPYGKMLVSGLGMAIFLVFLPAWLAGRTASSGRSEGLGLALAMALSIFLRALGSGSDWSMVYPLAFLILAITAIWLLFQANLAPEGPPALAASISFGKLAGLSLGVCAAFLMVYFAFASPTVIARWTGFSYPLIVGALVVALALFVALLSWPRFTRLLDRRFVLAWNALFVLALVLTILPHQVSLPMERAAYPIGAPPVSPLAILPLLVMLLLAPVVALDLALFSRAIVAGRPSTPQVGAAFTLAAAYFLAMLFFHIFTTIYDYAPVVGPLFRDRFWLVYLLAGLGLALPVLLLRQEMFAFQPFESARPTVATSALALGAIIVLALNTLRLPAPVHSGELTIMTYNIQQGYDELGAKNLAGQLAVIQKIDPDILGLQESDTARIANGNVDAVRYFADQLGMHSYYGPTTTTGTFGIALLSKYPIENPQTFFMFSEGEQTATIQAQVSVDGQVYNFFVTHLGNSGPIVQLEDMLVRIQGLENVIAMGDYNFRPATEQYELMTQTLADSWLLRWPDGKQIRGYSPEERIDHIFISPEMMPLKAEYVVNPASDHPYMYVVIKP